MKNCEQTKGQSVLQHGISVKNYLFDLINHLKNGSPLKHEWRLPTWVYDNKDLLLSNLPNDRTLKLYTIFHDCGKPYCRVVDADGKVHFPNHAEISYQTFQSIHNDSITAFLIKSDMDIHTLKSEGVEEFAKNPYALTLLLSGLSEIHSNALMFGGLESTSFKIKWKCINQRGKSIINQIKNKK